MAGNDYVDLFYLTYNAIDAITKKDLVDYNEKMKNKVVADDCESIRKCAYQWKTHQWTGGHKYK